MLRRWQDGGRARKEELEWLSNKDAPPTVATMASAVVRPRTKDVHPADGGFNPAASLAATAAAATAGQPCQQCGTEKTPWWLVSYRSSCMVPELRFDWHNRVKLHRRAVRVANFCPATAGDDELGWPSNNDAFPAVKAKPTPAARPQIAFGGGGGGSGWWN